MTPHMVRYTVRPDQAAQNEELLVALFAELEQVKPKGLRYAAFKLRDGVTYIHFSWMDAENGHSALRHLNALRAFHAGLSRRCDETPVRTELSEIGSFGLFAEG